MKFNQPFFHLILLFIVTCTCSKVLATDSTKYRILKGEIICNKPQWVVFTYKTLNNQLDVDSAFLENGTNYIELQGMEACNTDEDLYTLTFRKTFGQFWLFFSEDTITASIDMTIPDFHKIDMEKMFFGSSATIEHSDYWKELHSIALKNIALKKEKDSLLFHDPESLRINDINKEIDSLLKADEKYSIKCVLNYRYSCNVVTALIGLTYNKNDLAPYVWLADSVEKRFPKSLWVKENVNSIRTRAKRQSKATTSKAPSDFELKDADNKIVRLLDYSGNYVLLDFWASWCTPCIKEMPNTIELQKKYSDKGLKIITISIDKNKEAWLKAVEKHNMQSLINLHDEKGEAARAYNASYVPLTILIDPKGEIIGSDLSGEELEGKLAEIYKNK